MEISSVSKAMGGAATMALARIDSAPVQGAVAPQLAPAVAVTAAATADSARFKDQRTPAPEQGVAGATERETSIDGRSGAVVVRVIDLSNGLVVRQQPTEALLKLRAYQRTVAESPQESQTEDRLA
jgi:hypothetical protein